MLFSKPQLQNTIFSLVEDVSHPTRLVRSELVEFGKTQNSTLKLRYYKLCVKDKCFVYNHELDMVREDSVVSRVIDWDASCDGSPSSTSS